MTSEKLVTTNRPRFWNLVNHSLFIMIIKVSDHIKNYRPKILVLSGVPSERPNLVDFANLIVKKISMMSTLHIVDKGLTN